MKRRDLLNHLRSHGCEFIREGSRHSWWWNPAQNKRASIPRHTEIDNNLARKICKDLGVEQKHLISDTGEDGIYELRERDVS